MGERSQIRDVGGVTQAARSRPELRTPVQQPCGVRLDQYWLTPSASTPPLLLAP
ncbi:hypothetical protein [Streptomyces humidus]|uniref:hypothetical protein n=1 Tax=Streptomyces humidus TaxID=52259 RepID=UPI00167DDE6D|nr:hypothetical protein [Streptomyces humidus]